MRCPFDDEALEQYAKAIDLGARTWERMFEDLARKLFREEQKEILKLLRQTGKKAIPYQHFLLEIEQYLEMAGERWRDEFLPLFTAYIGAQGQTTAATFGMSFNIQSATTQAFLKEYTMTFAEGIVGRTSQAVKDIIVKGQEEGWSIPQMRNALMDEFDDFSRTRAVNIARTETIRSSNAGAMDGYTQAGVERAQWYAAIDGRQCVFCDEMHKKYGPGTQGFVIGTTLWDVDQEMTVQAGEQTRTMKFRYEKVDYPPLHTKCRCTVLPIV